MDIGFILMEKQYYKKNHVIPYLKFHLEIWNKNENSSNGINIFKTKKYRYTKMKDVGKYTIIRLSQQLLNIIIID